MNRNQEKAHRHAYPKEQSFVYKTLNASGKINCKQALCTWANLRRLQRQDKSHALWSAWLIHDRRAKSVGTGTSHACLAANNMYLQLKARATTFLHSEVSSGNSTVAWKARHVMLFACPNREVLVLRLSSVTVQHQECDILSQREAVFIERVLASLPNTNKPQNGRRSIIRSAYPNCNSSETTQTIISH
jgi:hypothetical protein